jgi:adenine-specific DNA-methyltransferase
MYAPKVVGGAGGGEYKRLQLPTGEMRVATEDELNDPTLAPAGARICRIDNLTSPRVREGRTGYYPIEIGGRTYLPQAGEWKTNRGGMERLRLAGRLHARSGSVGYVRFFDDFPVFALSATWTDTGIAGRPGDKLYVVQSSPKVVVRCLLMSTDPGDLVLDPTCGSGTTAYVAEEWGRRWITIDTSRVALALARTRLMAARYPYYLLADSPEGVRKEAEVTEKIPPDYKTDGDVRKGFVYRRVPHVTLKSIANNPDIKEGMTRAEIDAAIAQRAEPEFLYDQPYEDANRVRVAGPFTVESLSPHRVLATEEEQPASEQRAQQDAGAGQFEMMILDNLRRAGVQNTRKNERLVFARLEPFAGRWLHAAGDYTDKEGTVRRIAVSIGPEHGTVGPEQVKEAAKEALVGVGFDLLVVCGFAFDAHAGETVKEFAPSDPAPKEGIVAEGEKKFGKLPVLLARMNPDLSMGEELLKKTGTGNLFMVFGEPDVKIDRTADGKVMVEIRGVDVYDPTTGQIRSNSTDDIACWFLDTNYNRESFFVRHAYFTGADEPYEKLKRALRAEIDEGAWSSLYSTISRPFDPPKTGRIAVKVINHYGDEVLKVFEI